MAYKKIRIRPESTNEFADVLHPETSADMVIETTDKQFVSSTDKENWNLKAGIAVATTVDDGLMSSEDKVKLDTLDPSASMPIGGGTFTGPAVAQNNTSYTTKQIRNIVFSVNEPLSTDGDNGDVWIVYTP
jgi:hypothetical protein